MKKILMVLIAAVVLHSCVDGKSKHAFCPGLDSLLTEYINGSSQAPIVFLTFSNVNGKEIISISDGDRYDRRKTDCFYKRGSKLIIIYSTDDKDRSYLFCTDSMNTFNNVITGYDEIRGDRGYTYISNYLTKNKVYRFMNCDSIIEGIGEIPQEYRAMDEDVISLKEINQTINTYINSHPAVLYLLKFNWINKIPFFAFEKAEFYDSQGLDGYFIRNKHVIAVYNSRNSPFIVHDKLIHKTDIHGFRQAPLSEDWLRNDPICFQILKQKKLMRVRDFRIFYDVLLK